MKQKLKLIGSSKEDDDDDQPMETGASEESEEEDSSDDSSDDSDGGGAADLAPEVAQSLMDLEYQLERNPAASDTHLQVSGRSRYLRMYELLLRSNPSQSLQQAGQAVF